MNKMKKLLLVLAVGAFVACNNSGSSTENNDSTAKKEDTATMAPTTPAPANDSTAKKDSAGMKPVDSPKVKK